MILFACCSVLTLVLPAVPESAANLPGREAVPTLSIVEIDGHLSFKTPLPTGRHDLEAVLVRQGWSGFIYVAKVGMDGTLVRLFHLRHDTSGGQPHGRLGEVPRTVDVRMRATTNPAHYSLFYKRTELVGGEPSVRRMTLRRDCCGYCLTDEGDGVRSCEVRAPNLIELERRHPETYAEFLRFARSCGTDEISVAPFRAPPRPR